MMELPEVNNIKNQLSENIIGKRIKTVKPPTKIHKFCWYNGDVAQYDNLIKGASVNSAEGFGIFVEIGFDNGYKLCFNDGVNVRLIDEDKIRKDYQLLIEFEDESKLLFNVAMYGSIILHHNDYDNEYYIKSKEGISPFSSEFKKYYYDLFTKVKPVCSAKAFLAAGQRIPGIGNGVLQDILFDAGIHQKRRINTFTEEDKEKLLNSITNILKSMIDNGGRDTEKDIFGNEGGYKVLLSKNTFKSPCPKCGAVLKKETYLGGSIYYCPCCQKNSDIMI